MNRLLPCLLVACLTGPALATPPAGETPDSAEILKALHRDQVAARDALEELRRKPLAEQHTDRVMDALDRFWAQTGRAHLGRAVNLTAAEVKALGIDDGPIGLLWGELKAVVGSTYDIEQVVQRFLEKAKPIIEGMVDQHMGRLRTDLDKTITATLAAEMSALQGAFDDEVAARFPAWTAALVVPVLPTP
jgi:ABC-type transporter Mla subunit MlaD